MQVLNYHARYRRFIFTNQNKTFSHTLHYIVNAFEFLVRVTYRILIPPDFLILFYSTAVTLLLEAMLVTHYTSGLPGEKTFEFVGKLSL